MVSVVRESFTLVADMSGYINQQLTSVGQILDYIIAIHIHIIKHLATYLVNYYLVNWGG